MSFEKATKTKAKLRAAIFGPAGSGKTYTSLLIASGMGGKVALIDSERGSANKYADRFTFDISELNKKNIDEYVNIITEASGKYDVLIIDSLTHAWNELLEDVDRIAKAKYKGNTWSAWSEGNPKQKKLVDVLLSFPGHIIATMRSKTEWQTSTTDKGSIRPIRVGLSPEQGKGIEYEFDLLLELNTDHAGNIIKDRTGKFQDVIIDKPGTEFGKSLVEWLNTGEEKKPEPKPQPPVETKTTPEVLKNPKGEIEIKPGDHKSILDKLGKCKNEEHLKIYYTIRDKFTWTVDELKEQNELIVKLRTEWEQDKELAKIL